MPQAVDSTIENMPWWARLLLGLAAAFGTGYLTGEISGGITAAVVYAGGILQKRPIDVRREQNGG